MKNYGLILMLCFSLSTLVAQEGTNSLESLAAEAASEMATAKNKPDSLLKVITDSKKLNYNKDSLVRARYDEALVAFYNYQISGFQHRREVFSWQHYSTIIIFFVVIFLVLAGLYFSWLQFRKGMKAEGDGALPETEVELSVSNVKVRSSVVGIVILVVSLAFFYLYLVYIYPINELF